MCRNTVSVLVLTTTILAVAPNVGAYYQDSCEITTSIEISPEVLEVDDFFGGTVAMHGDVAVIGAFAGVDDGLVRVFRFNGSDWLQEATLFSPLGTIDGRFGKALAVIDEVIAVGEPRFGDEGVVDSGAAHVFRYDGANWNLEATLIPPDPTETGGFGHSLAVNGNVLAVGRPVINAGFETPGAVYVYRFDSGLWQQETVLDSPAAYPFDGFGRSVSVDGDVLVIGQRAQFSNDLNPSVFVYRFDSGQWGYEATLMPGDTSSMNTNFGGRVSVSGNRIVSGNVWDDDAGINSGAIYVFAYDGSEWIEETKITPTGAIGGEFVGHRLAFDAGVIVTGHGHSDGPFVNVGRAYSFTFNGTEWVQARYLLAEPAFRDFLGSSVAVSGTHVLVGAQGRNDTGAAYVFELPWLDCNADPALPIGCNFADTATDCQGDGIPDYCQIDGNDVLPEGGDLVPDECNCTVEIACNDNNVCNGMETCELATSLCLPGTPLETDDGIACTVDLCDPLTGVTHVPDDAACDDGTTCTIDTCNPVGGCEYALHPDTIVFGDLVPVFGVVDFDDVLCVLNGFADFSACPQGDVYGIPGGCSVPDGVIDFDDVVAVLDAFAGTGCPDICP